MQQEGYDLFTEFLMGGYDLEECPEELGEIVNRLLEQYYTAGGIDRVRERLAGFLICFFEHLSRVETLERNLNQLLTDSQMGVVASSATNEHLDAILVTFNTQIFTCPVTENTNTKS